MTRMLVVIVIIAELVMTKTALATEPATYAFPGFGTDTFSATSFSQPKSFHVIRDPFDPNNSSAVYKFSIKPAPCIDIDCPQQSVRSTIVQSATAIQPKEAWYGWEMYFPKNFPVGGEQSRGFQIFNEFKDQPTCMLSALSLDLSGRDKYLSWMMQKPTGNPAGQYGDDCIPTYKKRVVAIKDIEGAWHRFELYARWTNKTDGRLKLYLDEKLVVNYSGNTCVSDCSQMLRYLFGSYLCCTSGTTKILRATVYYRYISRALRRDQLKWN